MLYLVLSTFAGFISACISDFLSRSFEGKSIFAWYLPFLAKWLLWLNKVDTKGMDTATLIETAADNVPIFRPLGYCVHCMQVWISVFVFAVFCTTFPEILSWYAYIPLWLVCSMTGSYFLRFISNY